MCNVSREIFTRRNALSNHRVDNDDPCQHGGDLLARLETTRCSIHCTCVLYLSISFLATISALHSPPPPRQSFHRTVLYFVIQHVGVRKTPLLWIRTRDGLRRSCTCVCACVVRACVRVTPAWFHRVQRSVSYGVSRSEKKKATFFSCPKKARVPLACCVIVILSVTVVHIVINARSMLSSVPLAQLFLPPSLYFSLPSLIPSLSVTPPPPFCQPAFQSHFPLAVGLSALFFSPFLPHPLSLSY